MTSLIEQLTNPEVPARELNEPVLLAAGWKKEYPSKSYSARYPEYGFGWFSADSVVMSRDNAPRPAENTDDALGLCKDDSEARRLLDWASTEMLLKQLGRKELPRVICEGLMRSMEE